MHRFGRNLVLTALAALALLGLAASSAAANGTPSISGTVSGTPIPNTVEVCAYREDHAGAVQCVNPTGNTGVYAIEGLAPGTYTVLFRSEDCSSGCPFVSQWYEDAARRADAKPIALAEGQEVTGIDATVLETALIEGQVLQAADQEPATGVIVCAYRPGQTRAIACTPDSSQGSYEIGGLTPGVQYVVEFRPEANCGGGGCSRENWEPQFFPGVPNRSEATLVSAGHSGIDAELGPAATITGHITEAVGGASVPSGSVGICAYPAGNESAAGTCGLVGSGGNYSVQGVPSGKTVIRFAGEFFSSQHADFETQYYEGKLTRASAEAVTLVAGQTKTGLDAAMAAGGKIHGTVTAATGGAPLSNVTVCASIPNVGGPCVQTNGSGEYTVPGLSSAKYVVNFRPPTRAYATVTYDGLPSESEGTLVTVAAGAATSGIDAALPAAAKVTGTVTQTGGTPAAEAYVCAYPGAATSPAGCDEVGEDGTYTVEGLAPGAYKIHFSPPEECGESGCIAANLVGQWWEDAPTRSTAASLTLAAGTTEEDVDATLQLGGHIAGTVTVAGGGASQSVEVCAYPAAGGESSACGFTEGDGYYEIPGLPTGSYKVEFVGSYECGEEACEVADYEAQFWHGASALAAATPVSVTVGTTHKGIDATMAAPAAPTATRSPTVTGTPAVGQTLTCGQGEWSGSPTGYAYLWLRDGTPIGGASASTYAVTEADAGHSLACKVTATNTLGSNSAESATVEVPKPSTPEGGGETPVTPDTPVAPVSPPPPGPGGNAPAPAAGKATAKPIAKVKGGKAQVMVSCSTAGPCKGTLKLTVKSKGKTVVLGQASSSLAAGKSATVKVKLSKAALAMLEAAGSKGLKANLTGTGLTSRPLTLRLVS